MEFNTFLNLISKIDDTSLPGKKAQNKMVPPSRLKLLTEQKNLIKNAKKAAVLALFYPDYDKKTKLVLILRKKYEGVHSAQVAFPGGKQEKQDSSLKATALRETFEEIGVPIKNIDIVKQLSEVYIPVSNFQVHAFLGVTTKTPNFIKQDDEVESILEIELKHFLNDNQVTAKKIKTSYDTEVEVPAFKLNNHIVWGATAMILSEIKDMLKQLL